MRYYIIAGEASGDLHGSNLIKGLVARDPEAEIRFWGGDLMQAACPEAQLVRHYREGAVMGLTDVIAKGRVLLGNVGLCKKDILAWKPDVVILIDYPGFNFKIARFAHENGFKVFYYIAPKTWASREKRNASLKAWVDRLYIIFPFEQTYFSSRGIPCSYKGNPLIDTVDGHAYARPVEGSYIAILPGSRKGEISRMMPLCMEVADLLGKQVIVAGAPALTAEDYDKYIGGRRHVKLLFGRTYDILKYADAAIINSGTASLEAVLTGTPQVVCWSTSALTMWAIRHIFKVDKRIKYISLGNMIAGRSVFRELIQEEFNTAAVFAELRRITEDSAYRSRMMEGYREIRQALGGSGASDAIAEEMVAVLKGQIR